jgi:hypothetical protein
MDIAMMNVSFYVPFRNGKHKIKNLSSTTYGDEPINIFPDILYSTLSIHKKTRQP